jgi:DNA-binding transcriptional ArsR family regulator
MTQSSVERRPPAEAFALLSNDLRLRIVQALGEAEGPLSFSTLRERVEERDSGRFNYHLGKLVGWFVVHTDEGYRLTWAGRQVVGAVVAGTYNAAVDFEPVPVDEACPRCGGEGLEATMEDEVAMVRCRDCEEWRLQFPFPPSTVDQFERDELPDAFDRWLRVTFARMLAGFCENCGGRFAAHYEEIPDDADPVTVVYTCDRCNLSAHVGVDQAATVHHVGAAFFADHGYPPHEHHLWQLPGFLDDRVVTVTDEGGERRVEVRLRLDDEELVARLGPDAALESVERNPVEPPVGRRE